MFLLIALCVGCRTPSQLEIQTDSLGIHCDGETLKSGTVIRITVPVEESEAEYRYLLILSLFDKTGAPLSLGGTATTASVWDLYPAESDGLPLQCKAVAGHQAVYVPDHMPFILTLTSENSPGSILRLDLLQQTRSSGNDWQNADSATHFFTDGTSIPSDLSTEDVSIPDLTLGRTYSWQLDDGQAYLTGLGTVAEQNLVLPTTVFLSPAGESPAGYVLDPSILPDNALSGCGQHYVVECHDGSLVTRPLSMEDGVKYAVKLLVYDVEAFARNCENSDLLNMKMLMKNGSYFLPSAVGYTVDPARYSEQDPLVLTITPNHEDFMYREDPVNGKEYPVVILGDAFKNCDSLLTVTFQDGAKIRDDQMYWTRGGMFSDCGSLLAVHNIPQTVTSMHRTFENCVSLSQTPVLPPALENLSQCFAGCSSMTQVPTLPDTITNISHAFKHCTSLTGTASVPGGAVDPTNWDILLYAYQDCPGLDIVYMDTCDSFPHTSYATDSAVEYLWDHAETGICPYCKTANPMTTILDNLTLVTDTMPAVMYSELVEFLTDIVPKDLLITCNRLTLTQDLAEYHPTLGSDPYILGFTYTPSCEAYVRFDFGGDIPRETIYHEMAHCYDYYWDYLRNESQWQSIHKAEGNTASQWYNYYTYAGYGPEDQRGETFAIALSKYFHDPSWLRANCPEMYEYMATRFPKA